jgi:hypothetical protein
MNTVPIGCKYVLQVDQYCQHEQKAVSRSVGRKCLPLHQKSKREDHPLKLPAASRTHSSQGLLQPPYLSNMKCFVAALSFASASAFVPGTPSLSRAGESLL